MADSTVPAGRPRRFRRLSVVVPAAAIGLLLAVPLWIGAAPPVARTPAASGLLAAGVAGANASANATIRLLSMSPIREISPAFYGADLRVYSPANAIDAAAYNATGLAYVRWPGGAVADEYNMTSDKIFGVGGHSYTPPSSLSQFVGWCLRLNCRAIVQLPGEIDSPATGAYDVWYIEQVEHFHPAYYEIGNEPALWRHFGVPWANWTSSQHVKVNATGYAHVVRAYIAAIRQVDPTARFLGLPGFGEGGYNEPQWIEATVAVNGPNLSGVAIHVYPSGPGPRHSAPQLAQFYRSVVGRGSLDHRVPRDLAAISAGCPTCTNLGLFVTELGAGNGGGSYGTYMRSYYDVPYIGTELLEGIALNVTNIDLFALESRYPGSLLNARGSGLSPVGRAYQSFFAPLGRGILPTTNLSLVPGVQYVATNGRSPGGADLLLISTNTTTTQPLDLVGSGLPVGPAMVVTWNSTIPTPVETFFPAGLPPAIAVPPLGMLLIEADFGLGTGLPEGPGLATSDPPATHVPPLSGGLSEGGSGGAPVGPAPAALRGSDLDGP